MGTRETEKKMKTPIIHTELKSTKELKKKKYLTHTQKKKEWNNFLISIPEMCIFFSIFSTPNIILNGFFFLLSHVSIYTSLFN